MLSLHQAEDTGLPTAVTSAAGAELQSDWFVTKNWTEITPILQMEKRGKELFMDWLRFTWKPGLIPVVLPPAKGSDTFWKQFACVCEQGDEVWQCRGEGGVGNVQPEPWQMYPLSKCRADFPYGPWSLLLHTCPRLTPKAKRSLLGRHCTTSPHQAQGRGGQRGARGPPSNWFPRDTPKRGLNADRACWDHSHH